MGYIGDKTQAIVTIVVDCSVDVEIFVCQGDTPEDMVNRAFETNPDLTRNSKQLNFGGPSKAVIDLDDGGDPVEVDL